MKKHKKKHSFCIIRKFISEDTPHEVFSEVHLRRHPPWGVFGDALPNCGNFFKKKNASEVHFRSRGILGFSLRVTPIGRWLKKFSKITRWPKEIVSIFFS